MRHKRQRKEEGASKIADRVIALVFIAVGTLWLLRVLYHVELHGETSFLVEACVAGLIAGFGLLFAREAFKE